MAAKGEVDGRELRDLKSILSGNGRDTLVRSNGDQVKITDLSTKVLGLYFSASWCGRCRRFTPKLAEIYKELASKGSDFEVVFVSSDKDGESFQEYFSEMPWLAIPFSDSLTRDRLNKQFSVNGIPKLVILDGNGNVINEKGFPVVEAFGLDGYPFTPEKIGKLKEDELAAKEYQTIQSVLVSPSRDFLISSNGDKIPVSDLEGKIVCLYFSTNRQCQEFTRLLADMYTKLKEKGEKFEVVLVSLDDEKSSFELDLAGMPWLAIPFEDMIINRLVRYFDLEDIPMLVVIGSDGKTLHKNVAELVGEYGIEAYPFTQEKLEECAEEEKARNEAQTLESLLVSGDLDYVIGKGGVKVPVSNLVGKNILLYFSAHWCGPCRSFTPILVETYHKIKKRDPASFEVVFLSSDEDQTSFDDYFASMPWLALPFGDEREKTLTRILKIYGIPSLVAIGPTGKTITTEADWLVANYGADAYPFTEERIKECDAEIEEMVKSMPERVENALHTKHELVRTERRGYRCNGCRELGHGWSFCCKECDFDLHPRCALDKVDVAKEVEKLEITNKEEGYVCDGDVCYKAS